MLTIIISFLVILLLAKPTIKFILKYYAYIGYACLIVGIYFLDRSNYQRISVSLLTAALFVGYFALYMVHREFDSCKHKNSVEEDSGWFHGDFGIWMGHQKVSRCLDCGNLDVLEVTIGEVSVCGLSRYLPKPENSVKLDYIADLIVTNSDRKRGIAMMKELKPAELIYVSWLITRNSHPTKTNYYGLREIVVDLLKE